MSNRLTLPRALIALATKAGAKPTSIRRYEETFALMGEASALLQIKQENWFRARWHRRHKMQGELKKAMETLK